MSVLSLVFDGVILIALVATIVYALRLSRQFDRMQADRAAFESLIQSLNIAAGRAEAAIRSLKEAAVGSADTVQEKINMARGLADELEIMIQAGDNLANRLGEAAARRGDDDKPPPLEKKTGERPAGAAPRSRAEKELLEAVQNAKTKEKRT